MLSRLCFGGGKNSVPGFLKCLVCISSHLYFITLFFRKKKKQQKKKPSLSILFLLPVHLGVDLGCKGSISYFCCTALSPLFVQRDTGECGMCCVPEPGTVTSNAAIGPQGDCRELQVTCCAGFWGTADSGWEAAWMERCNPK